MESLSLSEAAVVLQPQTEPRRTRRDHHLPLTDRHDRGLHTLYSRLTLPFLLLLLLTSWWAGPAAAREAVIGRSLGAGAGERFAQSEPLVGPPPAARPLQAPAEVTKSGLPRQQQHPVSHGDYTV